MRCLVLSLAFFFATFCGFAQRTTPSVFGLQGTITDSSGRGVAGALVYLTLPGQKAGIAYAHADTSGHYQVSFRSAVDTLWLVVRMLGYRTATVPFRVDTSGLNVDAVLTAEQTTLNEVIVRSVRNRPAFNDTTTFVAGQYADGTQASLEDVLRKIPGFRVGEDGKISYKGQEISSIYLDGENLTGENYTRISRNLRPSLIENIQAIERFVENKLLGGLTASQQTVLNITIPADRKKLIFGDVNALYGPGQYRKGMANVFSYQKSFRAYLLGTHNNIGEQHNADASEKTGLSAQVAIRPLLPDMPVYTGLFRPDLANINNETTGSLATVYKSKESFKLLTELSVYTDGATQTLRNASRYILSNSDSILVLNQTDQISRQRRSIQLRNQLYVTLSPRANLTYEFLLGGFDSQMDNQLSIFTQIANTSTRAFVDQVLASRASYQQQRALVTTRLNTKSALQLTLFQNWNRLPQQLTLQAPVQQLAALNSLTDTTSLVQNARAQQNTHSYNVEYFRSAKFIAYSVVASAEFTHAQLRASLIPVEPPVWGLLNLYQQKFFVKLKASKSVNNLTVSADAGMNSTSFNYLYPDTTRLKQAFIFPDMRLLFRYSFGINTELRTSYILTRRFSQANDLLTQPVITDYRSVNRGVWQLLNQREQVLSVFFTRSDNAQLSTLEISASHTRRSSDLFQAVQIVELSSTSTAFVGPPTQITSVQAQGSRFLSALSTRVSLETSVNQLTIYNIINDSGLRQNFLTSISQTLRLGTGFSGPVNVYAGSTLSATRFRTNTQQTKSSGVNTLIQSYVQMRYRYRGFDLNAKMDHLVLNSKSFVVLDASGQYTPKSSPFVFFVTVRNATDRQFIEQWTLTDRISSTNSYRLLSRIIMAGATIKF